MFARYYTFYNYYFQSVINNSLFVKSAACAENCIVLNFTREVTIVLTANKFRFPIGWCRLDTDSLVCEI